MNEILKLKLFSLLSEASAVTNEEMETAYEKLVNKIQSLQSDEDYIKIFRILNMTRIELISLKTHLQYGQGEKCVQKNVLAESYFIALR